MTLTKSKPKIVWDPDNNDAYPRSNKLIIKQIMLALDAPEDEYNVIQVIKILLDNLLKKYVDV